MKELTELNECPNCGHDEYYYYQAVSGKIAYREKFNEFDSEDADNTEMWDSVSFGKKYKTIYCGNCQQKIATDNR